MSLVLEFFPEAAAELECVTGSYEARVPGLGVRFRLERENTLNLSGLDYCSAAAIVSNQT